MILLNSFSLNMLANLPSQPLFTEISVDEAKVLFENDGLQSAVGHADTANIFAGILGRPVEVARSTVNLRNGDTAVIGQYIGRRLLEGATTLPEGSTIKWIKVTL